MLMQTLPKKIAGKSGYLWGEVRLSVKSQSSSRFSLRARGVGFCHAQEEPERLLSDAAPTALPQRNSPLTPCGQIQSQKVETLDIYRCSELPMIRN
ncbi:unnamed protein product [Caretta caretta]